MLALAPPIPPWTVLPTPTVESAKRGPVRLASSLAPALDLAFGLDRDDTLPEDIAACVAALHRGPLGRVASMPTVSAETSA